MINNSDTEQSNTQTDDLVNLDKFRPLVNYIVDLIHQRSLQRATKSQLFKFGWRGLVEGFESWEGEQRGPGFEAHLRAGARQAMLDAIREDPDDSFATVTKLTDKEMKELLTPRERTVFMLRYCDSFFDCEVAEVMGVTPEAVTNIRAGAISRIQKHLAGI